MWGILIKWEESGLKWFSTRDSLTQGTFSLTFPLRDKQKESPRQPTNLIVPNEKSLYFESMDEKKFVFPKNENGSHPYRSQ